MKSELERGIKTEFFNLRVDPILKERWVAQVPVELRAPLIRAIMNKLLEELPSGGDILLHHLQHGNFSLIRAMKRRPNQRSRKNAYLGR